MSSLRVRLTYSIGVNPLKTATIVLGHSTWNDRGDLFFSRDLKWAQKELIKELKGT